MRLSDKDYWSKAEVQAMTGLSYSRQNEYSAQAGITIKTVRENGFERDQYSTKDLKKLLKRVGYQQHELDGEQCLLRVTRIIKL